VRDVQLAHKAATMYYLQNETMETIGASLGISRSTVSRLLQAARDHGLVEIKVKSPSQSGSRTARMIAKRFGVRVHLVPVRQRATYMQQLDQVGLVAARLLSDWFQPGQTLGVAWGTTVTAIAENLVPRPREGTAVVQLNGAANTQTTGLAYASDLIGTFARVFDSAAYYFPVPAFFDYAETKALMWRERSIKRVHEIHEQVDLALFGVGALEASMPSHVYASGYLDDDDMTELFKERVVGDVCTVFFRHDGSYRDIALNRRATGPTPEELQRIPRRMCVVAQAAKAPAVIGALNAQVMTDLVIDEPTARAVCDLLDGKQPRYR